MSPEDVTLSAGEPALDRRPPREAAHDELAEAFDFTVPPVSPRAVLPVDAGPRAPAPLARTGEDRHPLASPPLRTAAPPLAPVVQRAAPPADEVVDPYETRLDGELAKLRQAITEAAGRPRRKPRPSRASPIW